MRRWIRKAFDRVSSNRTARARRARHAQLEESAGAWSGRTETGAEYVERTRPRSSRPSARWEAVMQESHVPKLNQPPRIDPPRFDELAASDSEVVRDLVADLRTARATISVYRLLIWHLARALRRDQADISERAIADIGDPTAIIPCPHCGGELYDNVLFDDERKVSACPSCRHEPGLTP